MTKPSKRFAALTLGFMLMVVGVASCHSDPTTSTSATSAVVGSSALASSAPATSGQTSAPPPQVSLRLGSFSTAIDYAPYLIAKAKGWFEEALKPYGAVPEYTTFQSLPPINESFATDRVDVVFEAEPPAIIGRAAGNDIRIAAISCSLKQEVIVPASSKTAGIKDLKGKKVAVLAGTSSHYGLLKIAKAAGLGAKDLLIVDMVPPDAKSAFETNQVAGWAVWPPWVEQEVVSNKGRVLPGGDAYIHSIMAVRGQMTDKHPEMIRAVVSAIERAKEWIRQSPTEAKEVIAGELKLDIRVVDLAWSKHDWTAQLTSTVMDDIQAKADFLKEQGMIRAPVNVKADLVRPVQPSK